MKGCLTVFHPGFDISVQDKAYEKWKKWMVIGEKTGCHQLPERSFFIGGYQMPVCARCTGAMLGYILAVPLYLKFGFKAGLSFFGCVAMLVDWSIQKAGIKESTNKRRFATGLLGGIGILSCQIKLIQMLVDAVHK